MMMRNKAEESEKTIKAIAEKAGLNVGLLEEILCELWQACVKSDSKGNMLPSIIDDVEKVLATMPDNVDKKKYIAAIVAFTSRHCVVSYLNNMSKTLMRLCDEFPCAGEA